MTEGRLKRGNEITRILCKMRKCLNLLESEDRHIKIESYNETETQFIGGLGESDLLINFYKTEIEKLEKEFKEL